MREITKEFKHAKKKEQEEEGKEEGRKKKRKKEEDENNKNRAGKTGKNTCYGSIRKLFGSTAPCKKLGMAAYAWHPVVKVGKNIGPKSLLVGELALHLAWAE